MGSFKQINNTNVLINVKYNNNNNDNNDNNNNDDDDDDDGAGKDRHKKKKPERVMLYDNCKLWCAILFVWAHLLNPYISPGADPYVNETHVMFFYVPRGWTVCVLTLTAYISGVFSRSLHSCSSDKFIFRMLFMVIIQIEVYFILNYLIPCCILGPRPAGNNKNNNNKKKKKNNKNNNNVVGHLWYLQSTIMWSCMLRLPIFKTNQYAIPILIVSFCSIFLMGLFPMNETVKK